MEEGEFVTIVGPSGCGKSSILSMLAGLIPPSSGSLSVNGNIGYMLQKDHLLEWKMCIRDRHEDWQNRHDMWYVPS